MMIVLVLITLLLVYLMNIVYIQMCVCACYCPWISKTYEFVLETALHFRGHSKFQTPFYNHVPMLNQNNPRLIIASTSISDRDLQLMKKKCNIMQISIEHPQFVRHVNMERNYKPILRTLDSPCQFLC